MDDIAYFKAKLAREVVNNPEGHTKIKTVQLLSLIELLEKRLNENEEMNDRMLEAEALTTRLVKEIFSFSTFLQAFSLQSQFHSWARQRLLEDKSEGQDFDA